MADIPLAPPTPSSSTAAATAVAPGLVAVQVSVSSVPAALEDLTRTIQANATPLVVSDANNLTLATVLGNITVALSQQLGVAEKQNLIQQLMSLMQVQRTLTLTLQPGSPPTQGALLFPMATAPVVIQTVHGPMFSSAPPPQAQPLAVGSDFHAVVLPPLPSPAAVLADAPTPATLMSLAARRPMAPIPVTENIFSVFASPSGANDPPAANPPSAKAVQQTYAPPTSQEAPAVRPTSVPLQTVQPAPFPQQIHIPAQTIAQPKQVPPPPVLQLGVPPQQETPSAPQAAPPVQQTVPTRAPLASPPLPSVQQTVLPQTPPPLQQPTPPPAAQSSGVAPQPAVGKTPAPAQQINVSVTLPKEPFSTPPPLPAPTTQTANLQTPQPVVSDKSAMPMTSKAFVFSATPNVHSSAQAPPHISSLLSPGNEVSLHVVSILPGSAQGGYAAQAPLPTLAPNQIIATVSGTGTDGQLLLKAGDATLFVKAQITAPVGTSLVVSVEEAQITSLVMLPHTEEPAFQSLPQVLAALEQVSPHALQNVMLNFLPRPTDALPGSLIFLLSAFSQGNVRNWLGDNTVDILANSGKSALVRSLSKELSEAGQPAQDAVVGEWRTYPIPLYAHNQFQSLTLYVHGDRDARKDQSERPSGVGKIRFLIDMRLSKLGAMQIDGFVQPKKLDMILRSENVLPEGLHHELRLGYIKAMEAVGYTGTLNFQVGRHHWMVMQKSAPPGIVT